MATCDLCRDQIYDGELHTPVTEGGLAMHRWCYHMGFALRLCQLAMAERRAKGLPTPTSPLFRDPTRPDN